MEIEIVTTKKKLTKSFIEQMREILLDEIDNASVIGFVNINPIVIILEINRFEYRKIYWNWFKSGTNHIRRTVKRKFTTEKCFKTEQDRDKYMQKLNEFKNEAVQVYI